MSSSRLPQVRSRPACNVVVALPCVLAAIAWHLVALASCGHGPPCMSANIAGCVHSLDVGHGARAAGLVLVGLVGAGGKEAQERARRFAREPRPRRLEQACEHLPRRRRRQQRACSRRRWSARRCMPAARLPAVAQPANYPAPLSRPLETLPRCGEKPGRRLDGEGGKGVVCRAQGEHRGHRASRREDDRLVGVAGQ